MKTQTIVLALALVAVTPAVLAAQDYVGGPGSKMLYIADNALARIRENHRESNSQQNPVTQTPAPQQQSTAQTSKQEVYSYAYTGREGHMAALGFLFTKPKSTPTTQTPKNEKKPATTNTNRTNNTYNPYVGPEGHRAAMGNAVRDARHDSTPAAPTYVKDLDTVAKNHQVTLDNKAADRSTKKTNNTFRYYLNEVGKAIAN